MFIYNRLKWSLWHTCRPGAETCPGPDTDEPKMDPFSRGGSDAKFSLWYGLVLFSSECVQWSVCVALYHYTGGRQQGWVQPSKQVEYRWGGTNTVWTCAQLKEAWHEKKKQKKKPAATTDCTVPLPLRCPKSGTGASAWLCMSWQDLHASGNMEK